MVHEEKLPWDLLEEILFRVPPKSLVRFRTVCERWNNLFNDKKFINNHKNTFQFVLATKSKIYSVNVIDLEIVVRELITLDNIPGLDESHIPQILVSCNDFLLCHNNKEAVVCNPWLTQSRWIKPDFKQNMHFEGVGYDNMNGYKILAALRWEEVPTYKYLWKIYDFVSDAWDDFNYKPKTVGDSTTQEKFGGRVFFQINAGVSLDGTLYSLGSCDVNKTSLCIIRIDFSMEKFSIFCDLPCERKHLCDALVLRVFKGDRFSFLKQCFETKKIEIWVTKDKVSNSKDVVWMSFMQVSIPNFPDLVEIKSNYHPSYFIDEKRRLVVCSCDETGRAWIYVVSENKLISKVRIDTAVDLWPRHCTYTPSLIPVPPSFGSTRTSLV